MKTIKVSYGGFETEQQVDECLYNAIYNQALEDFSKKMKEVNLTNSFILYYGDEIDLEEFMNLASDEILEQLKNGASLTEYTATNTCEWIKYDYRTMCPKNHGNIDNPYWRIPTDMKYLSYCPYCGKRIRLVE